MPRRDGTAVWERVEGAGPRLALTFDDCDRPEAWAAILDILSGRGLQATFFALGMRVAEHPDLARRTVAEGHAVGSHGWDHAVLAGVPPGEVRWRLERDRATWTSVTGRAPSPLFRPPYGAFDGVTLAAARRAGYERTVLWDVDPEDWREPGSTVIADRVLSGVRAGSIVLLHVVEQTAEALPSILSGLSSRGLAPVELPRLLPS